MHKHVKQDLGKKAFKSPRFRGGGVERRIEQEWPNKKDGILESSSNRYPRKKRKTLREVRSREFAVRGERRKRMGWA